VVAGWGRREPRGRRCALARTTSRYVTIPPKIPQREVRETKAAPSPALSAAPADIHIPHLPLPPPLPSSPPHVSGRAHLRSFSPLPPAVSFVLFVNFAVALVVLHVIPERESRPPLSPPPPRCDFAVPRVTCERGDRRSLTISRSQFGD
jgi:hypothetical protein